MKLIAPSILSADFSKLSDELVRIEKSGADIIHIDVMDGHFVPNLTFGAPVVKAIRHCTKLPFDVHLMISNPLKYIGDFTAAGADSITFHIESDDDPTKVINEIKKHNIKAAVSVKPNTAAEVIFPYLPYVDTVLVMTVEPGFGGQEFMSDMLGKIKSIKSEIDRLGRDIKIEVDGGINFTTAVSASNAGADIFVAGNTLFSAENMADAVEAMKAALKA